MDSRVANSDKERLKKRLLREVSSFYKRDHRAWKAPIVDLLRELRDMGTQGVFFGGTLRSLLVGSLPGKSRGRPRDIDIVVSGVSLELLEDHFRDSLVRKTRFGGLQLRRASWHFDLWPLHKTWAFVHDSVDDPDFELLPKTTFLNLEAVAVELWPRGGRARRIFSGDDQFFEGLVTKTLEINREENPYPELCVVRALVMASNLGFQLGPGLVRYISAQGQALSASDLIDVQVKHYGAQVRSSETLQEWIRFISEEQARHTGEAVHLPLVG